jgi:hypothetical protein
MTNTLKSQIVRLIESNGDSNQTCLTFSPEDGWNVSWQPSDREEDAVCVISKDSLNEWANGFEWDDNQYDLADEYVRDNIGDWLRDTEISMTQILAHL